MAKVKTDESEAKGKSKSKDAKPKKPGRNDLVKEVNQDGKARFKFDEPMTETGEFVSYNGGKGTHAFCVVRIGDGKKFRSGKTGLKYLMAEKGGTLFEIVAAQSKRGRPAKKKNEGVEAPAVDKAVVAPASPQPAVTVSPTAASPGVPAAPAVVTGQDEVKPDPFDFMDGKEEDKSK